MKGVSYSFVIVFLTITVLSLIVVQKTMVGHQRENIYIKSRIVDMNRMYEGITRDVDKAIEIIVKRSVSVIINDVISNGRGVDQADFRIEELMINGTLNGTQKLLMENSTLINWMDAMEYVSEIKGYDLTLTLNDVEVKAYDSWNILINGEMEVNLSEKNNVANISRTFQISKLVSVENFEDPLYALNTFGRGTNVIEKSDSDFTDFLILGDGVNSYSSGVSIIVDSSEAGGVSNKDEKILVVNDASSIDPSVINQFKGLVTESNKPIGVNVPSVVNVSSIGSIENNTYILVDGDGEEIWNIDNLFYHVRDSKYYTSTNGPSFLDRLEGKYQVQAKYSSQTEFEIGLESFVDKEYLDDLDLDIKMEQTNIDYLYFSNTTINGNQVKGMSSSFRIDNMGTLNSTRQSVYEVNQLIV